MNKMSHNGLKVSSRQVPLKDVTTLTRRRPNRSDHRWQGTPFTRKLPPNLVSHPDNSGTKLSKISFTPVKSRNWYTSNSCRSTYDSNFANLHVRTLRSHLDLVWTPVTRRGPPTYTPEEGYPAAFILRVVPGSELFRSGDTSFLCLIT